MEKIRVLLESAHEQDSPIDALEKLLQRHPLPDLVRQLVPEDIELDDREDLGDISRDIRQFREDNDKERSDVAWRCRFLHFATSLTHVFFDPLSFVSPLPQRLWVDLDETKSPSVKLKYHHNLPTQLIKIIVYTVKRNKIQEMTENRYAIDVETGLVMPSSRGSFIHVSITGDGVCRLVRRHSELPDLAIMLTYQGQFQGVFHSEKNPVVTAIHRAPAH